MGPPRIIDIFPSVGPFKNIDIFVLMGPLRITDINIRRWLWAHPGISTSFLRRAHSGLSATLFGNGCGPTQDYWHLCFSRPIQKCRHCCFSLEVGPFKTFGIISQGAHTGLCTLRNCGPMHIIRPHLHDGPMWALPKVSAYLHMDSTDYFEQCMLHGLIKEEDCAEGDESMPNFLSLQMHNSVPPHMLQLKVGCVCCLMRNLFIRKGLVKNTQVIVWTLQRRFIQVQVIDNSTNTLGEIHCILRIRFEFAPTYSSWTIERVQFPLWLVYTCTFNSCIGLTLDKTDVDLRTSMFAHGQLYTALSRIHRRDDCKLLFASGNSPDTPNVVYKQLLLYIVSRYGE